MYDTTMRGFRIATHELVAKARAVVSNGPTPQAVQDFADYERELVSEMEDTLTSDNISAQDAENLTALLDGLRDRETMMNELLALADRLENVEGQNASLVEV